MFELLTIILIVLKLVGLISLTWVQVFIPMYIAVGLYIITFGVGFVGSFIAMRDKK